MSLTTSRLAFSTRATPSAQWAEFPPTDLDALNALPPARRTSFGR